MLPRRVEDVERPLQTEGPIPLAKGGAVAGWGGGVAVDSGNITQAGKLVGCTRHQPGAATTVIYTSNHDDGRSHEVRGSWSDLFKR